MLMGEIVCDKGAVQQIRVIECRAVRISLCGRHTEIFCRHSWPRPSQLLHNILASGNARGGKYHGGPNVAGAGSRLHRRHRYGAGKKRRFFGWQPASANNLIIGARPKEAWLFGEGVALLLSSAPKPRNLPAAKTAAARAPVIKWLSCRILSHQAQKKK